MRKVRVENMTTKETRVIDLGDGALGSWFDVIPYRLLPEIIRDMDIKPNVDNIKKCEFTIMGTNFTLELDLP